jgi:hypothetical protein
MSVCETAYLFEVGKSEAENCSFHATSTCNSVDALIHDGAPYSFELTWTFCLVLYAFIAVLLHVIACCRFLSTWSYIMKTCRSQSFDDSTCPASRSIAPSPMRSSCDKFLACEECPICLLSFDDEQHYDYVVSCHCQKHFHHDCLASWLERSTSCPCCRRDLIGASNNTAKQHISGWMADLSVYVGFPPR